MHLVFTNGSENYLIDKHNSCSTDISHWSHNSVAYTCIQFLLQLVDLVIKTLLKNFKPKTEVLSRQETFALQSQNGYSSAPIHRTMYALIASST